MRRTTYRADKSGRRLTMRSLTVAMGFVLVLAACTSGTSEEPATTDTTPTQGTDTTPAQGTDTTSAPGTTPTDVAERGTSLVIGAVAGQEPAHFGYADEGEGAPTYMGNVVEFLLREGEGGEVGPHLAESFEVSEDGREIDFTLREATFHNGKSLSADDVIYSFDVMAGSADDFLSGIFDSVEAIEKVDDRTVKVVLVDPSSREFLRSMATFQGLVIPEGSYEGLPEGELPVGTGPFVLDEWQPESHIELTRFDDYWGEAPFFEQITWRFFADDAATTSALRAGEVALIGIAEPSLVGQLEDETGLRVQNVGGGFYSVLWLNGADPVMEDDRVRQAVAHAIDRQAFVDGVFGGRTEATCVTLDSSVVGGVNSDYCPYPYDPDRSRELLAAAGVDDLELELKVVARSLAPVLGEIIVQQLADVGITVQMQVLEAAAWFEDVYQNGTYQMSLGSGAFMAVDQRGDFVTCPNPWTKDCPPEDFVELVEQARVTQDESQWIERRREALERFAEGASWIALVQVPAYVAMDDGLADVETLEATGILDFRSLRWSD